MKKRSSPAAVRPPIYHLSAPMASRNPSLLLSDPRRAVGWWWPLALLFWIGMPAERVGDDEYEGERPLLAGGDEGPAAAADDEAADAADAAAAAAAAVAVGDDDDDAAPLGVLTLACWWLWWCLLGCWAEEPWIEGPCWRKAAMKEDRKKGRCEGMMGVVRVCICLSVLPLFACSFVCDVCAREWRDVEMRI